jgi:biopolymer transport protein ExbD
LSLFNRRKSVSPPVINVTPLIDVLLVLLIIFMVIQPRNEASLPIKPTEDTKVNLPAPPETLMLTVSRELRLELNSKPVEIEQLLPLLSTLMEQRTSGTRALFIRAPSALAYEPVVLLIDLAKGAGVKTVGLVREET